MAIVFVSNLSLVMTLLTILLIRMDIAASLTTWTMVVFVVFLALAWIYTLLATHGLLIWIRGELPLSKILWENDHAKYVTTSVSSSSDSTSSTRPRRTIEYFVWGSTQPNATVMVVCHGSNTTGKYLNEFLYPHPTMVALNVKVISPSFPGHGGSDAQPFRRIHDWPKDDLMPILEAEQVDTFFVQGTSYGTAHAMAVASHFGGGQTTGRRCLAMGLHVPYLPEPICREFKFHTDADYLWSQSTLMQAWILLPSLSLLSLLQSQLAKGLSLLKEGPLVQAENPQLIRALQADVQRSFLRGPVGQVYEMFNATTNQQWPDPRTIDCQNVAIWYAQDDGACPPAHGKWLADVFTQKTQEGTKLNINIRSEKKGLGHFTYMGNEDRDRGIMTRVLLDMISKNSKQRSRNDSL